MNFLNYFLFFKPTQKVGNFLCVILLITISILGSVNLVSGATLININTANATELDTIPEVGPSTAAKIIAYREANGPFSVIEDIMKVAGIKEATFAKMKDFITVGNDNSGSGNEGEIDIATSTATSTTTTNTATTTASSTASTNATTQVVYRYISVHSSSDDLSNYEEPANLEVSAGRSRLSYVGIPIKFSAKIKATGVIANQSQKVIWSFGDGTSLMGESVEHIYKNVGDYNVVINVNVGDKTAVARGAVKILEPQVSLVQADSDNFSVKNFGDYEINLNNWSVWLGNFYYIFPLDTILNAGQTLAVSAEYSGLKINDDNKIILLDPSRKEKSTLIARRQDITIPEGNSVIAVDNFTPSEIEQINKSIAIYKAKLIEQQATTTKENYVSKTTYERQKDLVAGETQVKQQTQLASVVEIFPSNINASTTKPPDQELLLSNQVENGSSLPGLISKIIHWPIKAVNSFVSFFYPGLKNSP